MHACSSREFLKYNSKSSSIKTFKRTLENHVNFPTHIILLLLNHFLAFGWQLKCLWICVTFPLVSTFLEGRNCFGQAQATWRNFDILWAQAYLFQTKPRYSFGQVNCPRSYVQFVAEIGLSHSSFTLRFPFFISHRAQPDCSYVIWMAFQ